MALMPGVVQRPVSALGGAMGAVLGVVIHVTAGEGDPYNEFANPANQVSSHFGIGNGQGGMADGLIEQYVDTANQSWAQAAGNGNYISVETEGEPTDPLTPAQVQSFGRIMTWVHNTYKVPLAITNTVGGQGLITHGDGGAAWGGHTGCPGPQRSAQRADILTAASPVMNPTNTTETNMLTQDPKCQGLLGVLARTATSTRSTARPTSAHWPNTSPSGGSAPQPTRLPASPPMVRGGFALLADNGGSQPAIYNIPCDGTYAK